MKKGRANSGAVLLTVMVIITLSALIGTTVLFAADAQRGTAQLTVSQAQLRALAWSGVQASMAELASQRGALLDGKAPTLTKSWSLYEGGGTGSVRLAVIGPGEAQWTSENGRLDINVSTKEMLAKLPGMTDELAAKVIGARGQGFGSPEELARVEGLSPTLLLGSPGATSGTAAGESGTSGLLSMVTVFSFDPNFTETSGGEAELKVNPTLRSSLFLRNSDHIHWALQPRAGNLVERVSKLGDEAAMAEHLYLAALTRLPDEEEKAAFVAWMKKHGATNPSKAIGDFAWALFSSTEWFIN